MSIAPQKRSAVAPVQVLYPIQIGLQFLPMPRSPATDLSESRVQQLVERLFDGFGQEGETIADIARAADLPHETVRRLYKNPEERNRSGPGFFIVEAIALARGVPLGDLVTEKHDLAGMGSPDA
jgi:hypothetical protein